MSPANFNPAEATTSRAIIAEAEVLNAEFQREPRSIEPFITAAEAMEKALADRIRHALNLEAAQIRAAERIAELGTEVNELKARLTASRSR